MKQREIVSRCWRCEQFQCFCFTATQASRQKGGKATQINYWLDDDIEKEYLEHLSKIHGLVK